MFRSLSTIMWLQTLKLQWPKSAYATRFTRYTTMHTCVTAPAPCVLIHRLVRKDSSTCNRLVHSGEYFQNHLTLKVKGKLVCQWRQLCRNCNFTVRAASKNECFKKFCNYSNKKQLPGHLFLRSSTETLQAVLQDYVRFILYGVHTRPWKGWRDVSAYSETYMCLTKVF